MEWLARLLQALGRYLVRRGVALLRAAPPTGAAQAAPTVDRRALARAIWEARVAGIPAAAWQGYGPAAGEAAESRSWRHDLPPEPTQAAGAAMAPARAAAAAPTPVMARPVRSTPPVALARMPAQPQAARPARPPSTRVSPWPDRLDPPAGPAWRDRGHAAAEAPWPRPADLEMKPKSSWLARLARRLRQTGASVQARPRGDESTAAREGRGARPDSDAATCPPRRPPAPHASPAASTRRVADAMPPHDPLGADKGDPDCATAMPHADASGPVARQDAAGIRWLLRTSPPAAAAPAAGNAEHPWPELPAWPPQTADHEPAARAAAARLLRLQAEQED